MPFALIGPEMNPKMPHALLLPFFLFSVLLFPLTPGLATDGASQQAKPEATTEAFPSMEECHTGYRKLSETLYKPNQRVYTDIEADTQWIYHTRLGPIFRAVAPETVHELFTHVDQNTRKEMLLLTHA